MLAAHIAAFDIALVRGHANRDRQPLQTFDLRKFQRIKGPMI